MNTPIDLIRKSSETGIRILTTDEDRKMFLMRESQRLGLEMILPPLTADVEFNYFDNIKEILIDQPALIIEKLTGKKVVNPLITNCGGMSNGIKSIEGKGQCKVQ